MVGLGKGKLALLSLIKMVLHGTALWNILTLTTVTSLGVVVADDNEATLPRFVENVPNITVTVGRDALLPCTVEQLKSFKVAWVQVDTQTILTIHKQVITRNPRISLLHDDHRTWHLNIKNVQEGDRGWYMCQVNTDPMRYRQGYVDVVVPPDIIDKESSGDITVREGQDVTLTCRAKGHPPPTIVWRREDNQDIVQDNDKSSVQVGGVSVVDSPSGSSSSVSDGAGTKMVEGETLVLTRVSRLQMGTYLCIASNGIPPSISKRAHLRIQFPPMAWVPQQLEGAYVGQELTIECHTEAFPMSINYWTNTKGDMIVAGDRYEPIVADNSYKVYMKLRIHRVHVDDFGTYKCIAKNSLGETDGVIKVYEIDPPKAHSNMVNGGKLLLPGGDEDEAGNPDDANASSPTSSHHKKDRKKYDNYIHSKGINDLIDKQRNSKTHEAKDLHRSPAHQGMRPPFGHPDHDSNATRALGFLPLAVAMPLWAAIASLAYYRILRRAW